MAEPVIWKFSVPSTISSSDTDTRTVCVALLVLAGMVKVRGVLRVL